jgi:hypothetical protein
MADYLESALTPEGIAEKRIWKDVSRASQPRPNAGDAGGVDDPAQPLSSGRALVEVKSRAVSGLRDGELPSGT